MGFDSFLASCFHMLQESCGDEGIVCVGGFGDVGSDDGDTGEVGARYGDGVNAVCESGVSISDCVVDGFVNNCGDTTVGVGGAVFRGGVWWW